MYIVRTYLSEQIKKEYENMEEIAKDFQLLEKPTKESFYRDILNGDLIEIENVDGKYVVTNHMLMDKKL